MPKITNTFHAGTMNRDSDDRLVQPGQYRLAVNANIGRSESSDVGALENLEGNFNVSQLQGFVNPRIIGSLRDQNEDRLYWFITSDNRDAIYEYHEQEDIIQPILVEEKEATEPVFDTFFVSPNEALTSFGGATSQTYRVTKNAGHSHMVTSPDPWVTINNPTGVDVEVTIDENPNEIHRESYLDFTNLTTGEVERRLVKQLHESAIANYVLLTPGLLVNNTGGYYIPGGSGSPGGATGTDGEAYSGPLPVEVDSSDGQEATSQGQVFIRSNQEENIIPTTGNLVFSVLMETVPDQLIEWQYLVNGVPATSPGSSGTINGGNLVIGDYSQSPPQPPALWTIPEADVATTITSGDQVTLQLTNLPSTDYMVNVLTMLDSSEVPMGTISFTSGAETGNPHGQTVTMRANPTGGSGTYASYEWQRLTEIGWVEVTASGGGTSELYSIVNGDTGQNATYRFQVTDSLGRIGVSTPVSLVWEPEQLGFGVNAIYFSGNNNSIVGTNVTLRCNVTGTTSQPTYQWQEISGGTWANIPGETGFDLEFHPAATADSGTYRCQVTYLGGITNSNELVLDIRPAAVIIGSNQPGDVITQGNEITFSVIDSVPMGGTIANYFWTLDGQEVNEGSPTLTLSYDDVNNLSEVYLDASVNTLGVTSNVITISKTTFDSFRGEFRFVQGSSIVDEGTTIEMEAIPINAQGTVTYVWQRQSEGGGWGTSGTASQGQGSNRRIITDSEPNDSANYRCFMTDGSGATAIAGPISITVQHIVTPVVVSYVGPLSVPAGTPINYSAVVTGGVPPYEWSVTITGPDGFPFESFPQESAIGNITPSSLPTTSYSDGDTVEINFYASDSTTGGAGSSAQFFQNVEITDAVSESLTLSPAAGSELVGDEGRDVTLEGSITGGTGTYTVTLFDVPQNQIITLGTSLSVGDTYSYTITGGTQAANEGDYFVFMTPTGDTSDVSTDTRSGTLRVEFITQPPLLLEWAQTAGSPTPFEGESISFQATLRNLIPGTITFARVIRPGDDVDVTVQVQALVPDATGTAVFTYTIGNVALDDTGEYRFQVDYTPSMGVTEGVSSGDTGPVITVQEVATPVEEGGTGNTGNSVWSDETLIYHSYISEGTATLTAGSSPIQSIVVWVGSDPNYLLNSSTNLPLNSGAALSSDGGSTWFASYDFPYSFFPPNYDQYMTFVATDQDGNEYVSDNIVLPVGGPSSDPVDLPDDIIF